MKTAAEALGATMSRAVGEHSGRRRRLTARWAGASGKENVGISNDNGRGNARTASPRVPEQRETDQGESGTKGKPRGAPDVEPVKIPVLAVQARRRPRSDTAAGRRNARLKDVGET